MKPTIEHPADAASEQRPRKRRSDGAEARERLLQAALRLFAEKGFQRTSTREIAQAAGVNIASISYYFRDKQGLYEAVFTEPMGTPADDVALIAALPDDLRAAMRAYIARFLEPLKQSDLVQLCTRLHFREMLEPTGMWDKELAGIRAAHQALVKLLARHLAVTKPDDDLHRLAFAITGLGLQLIVTYDVIQTVRPGLLKSPRAIDAWAERLTDYAQAMLAAEATRRAAIQEQQEPSSTQTP